MSHYTRITANSDTIVINLSQYLYDAGKTELMVIGHSTEANPICLQLKERKGKLIKNGRNEPIYHKITVAENESFILMEKLS